MRFLILLLFLFLPVVGFAQSKADFERVMGKFMKFYNHKQGDSIVNMWSASVKKEVAGMWGPKQLDTMQQKYGKIESYKYIKIETTDYGPAVFFKTIFSKIETNGSSFILNKKNYIEAFMLLTSEPIIKDKPKKTK